MRQSLPLLEAVRTTAFPYPGLSSLTQTSRPSETVFVAVDTRLNNREELETRLGLASGTSLEHMFAALYAELGAGMASVLRGAFAFAIRDGENGSVFAARDIFGLCPVYHAQDGDALIFGSSSLDVRTALARPPELCDIMMADFIGGQFKDSTLTFFEEINRLPPAHTARFEGRELILERYWDPLEINKPQPDNPGTHFRELLDRSVSRDWVEGETAVTLSGGLDSSALIGSVHAQALNSEPMSAIAMTYNKTAGWTDGPCIDAMLQDIPMVLTALPSDSFDPLHRIDEALDIMDGPYFGYGHAVSAQIAGSAQEMGHTNILSGHGGDEIVSYGFGRMHELARAGRWIELWKNLPAIPGLYGGRRWTSFRVYLRYNRTFRWFDNHVVARLRRRARQKKKKIARSPSSTKWLSQRLRSKIDEDRYDNHSVTRRPDHTERMAHAEFISTPIQAIALEGFALCSRAQGVRTLMPFFDQDLVEASLCLPSRWKLSGGYSRFILREAMRGRVPDLVRLRKSKFDFSKNFMRGLFADRERLMHLTDPTRNNLHHFISETELKRLREVARSEDPSVANIVDAYALWRIAVLAIWLERLDAQPNKRAVDTMSEDSVA